MGKGVWRWGEREIIYLSLHCHHENDSCIKMGSDESHFKVSVGSDGQSHKTVSTNHSLFVMLSYCFVPALDWLFISSIGRDRRRKNPVLSVLRN